MQLHQRGTADRLLHAQLAALHLPGEVDFAFAGQQRNGAHLAQIYAHGVIGIDRLLNNLRGVQVFFLYVLGMEKISILVERNGEAIRRICKKLIFEMIH